MSTANVAGVEVDTRHWIGGRRVASAAVFTDLSPIDEQPLAEVARGGEAEVAAAVRAAGDAFGGWSATPPKDRAAVLHAIADGIEARAAELAAVETADNGALLRSHRAQRDAAGRAQLPVLRRLAGRAGRRASWRSAATARRCPGPRPG